MDGWMDGWRVSYLASSSFILTYSQVIHDHDMMVQEILQKHTLVCT